MKPRSLHTINDTPSQSQYIRNRDELETAKIRFSDNITNGISVLVQGHGYSRERAADLILDQIRQSDELPTDEEVFRVMRHLGIGIEQARKSIIVASALKRVQEQRGVQEAAAIDYLSSCLTTMKLLGSLEKNVAEKHQSSVAFSPSSTISEEFMNSTLANPSPATSIKSSSTSRDRSKTATTTPGRRKNLKIANKSRQMSKPPKPSRKRSKEEDKPSSSDKVDVQVVEKALLVNCKTSSPSVRQPVKRVSSHREELDSQVPSVAKRQRLDSA